MADKSLLEFADRLNTIHPLIMREFAKRQSNELLRGQITLQQFIILEWLIGHKGRSMNEITEFMGVTRAATTGVIDRLVRDGYCLRYGDPNDRRVIKINMTHKAENLVRKIVRQRKEMTIEIFGKISQYERDEYLRILSNIRDALQEKTQ